MLQDYNTEQENLKIVSKDDLHIGDLCKYAYSRTGSVKWLYGRIFEIYPRFVRVNLESYTDTLNFDAKGFLRSAGTDFIKLVEIVSNETGAVLYSDYEHKDHFRLIDLHEEDKNAES
jgi:hypothetical protein